MSALRYAPATSAVATSRPSLASIIMVRKSASEETVGDMVCDLSYRSRCFLPLAQVRPLANGTVTLVFDKIHNTQALFLFLLC